MHAAAPRRDRLHGGPGHAVDAYEVEPLRQVFALRGRYRLSLLRATCAPIETPARAARLSHCRLSCVDAVDRPLWWATRRWPSKILATENGAITGWPGRDRRRLIARIRWHDRTAENHLPRPINCGPVGSLATATLTFSSWLDRLPQRLRKNGQQPQHGCSARRCGWRSPCNVWPSVRRCLVGICPARASSHFFVRSHRLAATLIAQQLLRWSLVT